VHASSAHEETGAPCKAGLLIYINTHITHPNTTIRIRRPSGSARWIGPRRMHRLRMRKRDPTAKQNYFFTSTRTSQTQTLLFVFVGQAAAQGGQGRSERIDCARGDGIPLQSKLNSLHQHAHHKPKHLSYSQAKRQRKVDRAEANASTAHEGTGSPCKAGLLLYINTHITNPNTTIRIRRPSGSARWIGPR